MRDEGEGNNGVKWCLECGAAIIETEPCAATPTGEGRILISMSGQQPEGSQPAARVRCANSHTYIIALHSGDGSEFGGWLIL